MLRIGEKLMKIWETLLDMVRRFGACEVRCWRLLSGKKISVSLVRR